MAKQQKRVHPRAQGKPPGTRCYVPGYMDDQQQFMVDQSQLGIAPLAVASAAKSVLHISFKTPSDKRAKKVIGGVIASANSGNLAAVAILDTRRSGAGIAKERAVWQGGYNQIKPDVMAVYTPVRSQIIAQIPPTVQKSPEAAAQWATSTLLGPPAKPTKPEVEAAVSPSVPPPSQPATPGAPSFGPITISLPTPAPSGGGGVTMPIPTTQLPGGEAQVPDEVAKPTQAGMAGGMDLSKLFLPGIGLFILAQVMGKKRR